MGLAARADIELPSVPPPQPEAVTTRVFLGESADITLRGVSRSGMPLEFVIRRGPQQGTLTAVERTGKSTARVTYTPKAGTVPGIDRFRYAVRAPGVGVSTPAEVIIEIAERPARFSAPARLEFPETAVGETAEESFVVGNEGGGRLAGEVSVEGPWKLVGGAAAYDLGPGDARRFTVRFVPTEARRFSGSVRFSHAEGALIGLEGVGYAPIEVVPLEIRLEGDGRREERNAEFTVRNHSEVDRTVGLVLPAAVLGPETVTVPAKSEETVALRTRGGFLGGVDDALVLTGAGGFRLRVPLKAAAAPARLIVAPERIDFGTLVAGKFGRVRLTVRNVGGSPANLRVALPEGVLFTPEPSYESLPPGEAREFEVSFARPAAGKLDGVLRIETDGQALEVPLRATVKPDPRSLPGGAAGAEGAPLPAATPEPKVNDFAPVEEIGVTRQDYRELDLTWKNVAPDARSYRLLLRRMAFDPAGRAVFRYEMLPQVKPRVVRDQVRATIGGLHPGERITIHVVSFDEAGSPSRLSPPFTIASKPKAPWAIPWRALAVGALVVFAGLLVWERRRQRALAG